MNRIADIVPRDRLLVANFASPARSGAEEADLFRRLARFAGVRSECTVMERTSGRIVLAVRCNGREVTLRIRPGHDMFPPSVFVSFLNTQLRGPRRLVSCRDGGWSGVALAEPAEEAELQAAIFAVRPELRWHLEVDPDERGLLAAVRDDPDSDEPRLVYADWLLERGDPRGELIALQCQGRDADRLLDVHYPVWTAHLPEWADTPVFARGFVDSFRVRSLGDLVGNRHAICALSPIPDVNGPLGEVRLSPDGRLAIARHRDTARVIDLFYPDDTIVDLPIGRVMRFTPDSRAVRVNEDVFDLPPPVRR